MQFIQGAPRSEQQWIDQTGRPTQAFFLYLTTLDRLIRLMFGSGNKASAPQPAPFIPLVQAANDTVAAAAGVPIGGLYANGNAVQIRLV